MKKIFFTFLTILCGVMVLAQSPSSFSYQAVIRDVDGSILSNQQVSVLIEIHEESIDGAIVFSENHEVTTSNQGIINVKVGSVENLDVVEWDLGAHFLKVSINEVVIGISQILSVPYALHAKTAGALNGEINETDPVFSNWDKSSGVNITESQISDLGDYIVSESDPNYTSSVAAEITTDDITNWNNKLENFTETDPNVAENFDFTNASTGDILQFNGAKWVKLTPNYLTSYTETDPVFSNSIAAKINASDTTYWNNKLDNYEETDPVFAVSVSAGISEEDITNWNNKEVYTPGEGIDITNLTISSTINPSYLDVKTTSEILELSPAEGYTLLNKTENALQVYDGIKWLSMPINCWPEPTEANAGSSQSITTNITSTTLDANEPITGHGIGQWSVTSGEGGSFSSTDSPTSSFSGEECTTYELKWTISTTCGISESSTTISFNNTPTQANAGADIHVRDGSTSINLSANTPEAGHGVGQWAILSGVGGSISETNNPNSSFTGQLYQVYELQWSIATNCSSSTDKIIIRFTEDGMPGENITDNEGNEYPTVKIGQQEWLAKNLLVTHYNNGDPIPYAPDILAAVLPLPDDYYTIYSPDLIDGLSTEPEVLNAYGAMYSWGAVTDARGVCPVGWRVPSNEDFQQLKDYVASINNADIGCQLSSCRQVDSPLGGECSTSEHPRWNYKPASDIFPPNTDIYGFSALPGGEVTTGIAFGFLGNYAFFMSSTEISSTTYKIWEFDCLCNFSNRTTSKDYGYSVRCIKEE